MRLGVQFGVEGSTVVPVQGSASTVWGQGKN